MKIKQIISLYLPPILMMGLIFYLSSLPDLKSDLPSSADLILRKIAHMIEYGILLWLWARAISGGVINKKSLYVGLAIAVLYAMTDEYHQLYVPGREGAIRDVLIDSAGAVVIFFRLLKQTKNPV